MLGIFDRYLLKNFLVPFGYALFGMVAIWLIYDLGENTATFQDAHLSPGMIALFYLTQLPFILVNWIPLAMLLGLLYVLTRMSRRNEVVSMLTAGVSLPRILLPLIGVGLLTVAATMALNYSLAPHSELARKTFIDEAQSRPGRRGTGLAGQTVNEVVMFDFSKYMNNLLELDPERRLARVQPGIVLDWLRDAAEEHQLTFGPDPAPGGQVLLACAQRDVDRLGTKNVVRIGTVHG